MKICILLLSVFCILSLEGCKEQALNNAVTNINETTIKEVKFLSSIFTNPQTIQLETVNESFIGQIINKIKK